MSRVHVHRGCGCLQPTVPCNPCKRSTEPTPKTIRVVHLDGFLEEFDGPITVEEIIGSLPKHFMTTPIQLMHGLVLLKLDTLLEPGRVYFVLPYSILRLNESSKDLVCLAKKLSGIAKAHRSKPRPTPLISSPENQGSNPRLNESSTDLSLANKFTSIVRAHRSMPNPTPLGSPQESTRSIQGSNRRPNDQCSIALICLVRKLRTIAKAYLSKPADLARSQERGSSQGSGPSLSEEDSNMSKSTKALSWKPLLGTIREISFNRRESDLRD
ncbi:hypothetical protein LXL04_028423 [Taraxacum kok-saghyz]